MLHKCGWVVLSVCVWAFVGGKKLPSKNTITKEGMKKFIQIGNKSQTQETILWLPKGQGDKVGLGL